VISTASAADSAIAISADAISSARARPAESAASCARSCIRGTGQLLGCGVRLADRECVGPRSTGRVCRTEAGDDLPVDRDVGRVGRLHLTQPLLVRRVQLLTRKIAEQTLELAGGPQERLAVRTGRGGVRAAEFRLEGIRRLPAVEVGRQEGQLGHRPLESEIVQKLPLVALLIRQPHEGDGHADAHQAGDECEREPQPQAEADVADPAHEVPPDEKPSP
jgi:hypothetical protein